MNIELNPCPVCGSEAVVEQSRYNNGWHPTCSKNNDHVKEFEGFSQRPDAGYATEKEAFEAWNKRFNP